MGYARQAVVNALIDESRRPWRRQQTSEAAVPERVGDRDAAAGVDDRLPIRAALAALPQRQRAVIVLRYFEDLDIATTAAALGTTTGTISSQTSKALGNLRRHLSDSTLAGLVAEGTA